MRHIGQLPAGQARVFSDYLVSRGIRNEVEREQDGTYTIWIHDEDQVVEASGHLARFSSDPNGADFKSAAAEAERIRVAEKADLEAYRKRIREGKETFRKFGGYGVGILTYAIIVLCVIVAIRTKLGADMEAMRPFFISDPAFSIGHGLPEVAAGQYWRVLSPILLHFGILHIVFNMMWFYQLGSMIEARGGALILFLLIVVTGALSNLAQFYVTHYPIFGGMSGVIYGLAGYVWIRGKFDPGSGLFLNSQSVAILLIWLVICYSGWVGHVANMAHLAGLVVGMIWGGISAATASRG